MSSQKENVEAVQRFIRHTMRPYLNQRVTEELRAEMAKDIDLALKDLMHRTLKIDVEINDLSEAVFSIKQRSLAEVINEYLPYQEPHPHFRKEHSET